MNWPMRCARAARGMRDATLRNQGHRIEPSEERAATRKGATARDAMKRASVLRWFAAFGLLTCLMGTASADAVVFLYHRFGEPRYPTTNIKVDQFEAQLRYLAAHHFAIWPVQRIVAYLKDGKPLPDHTAAITIDDAYLSVYREAYPRLKARGWPFTVFVSTRAVDRHYSGFMSWDEMREMERNGASFADHSITHAHLVLHRPGETQQQWRGRVSAEVTGAQRRLHRELGVTAKIFAYPYGEYDTALAQVVRDLGYVAFGQQSGPIGRHADLRALPRFPMAGVYAALPDFEQKAQTLELPVDQVMPWDPILHADRRPLLTVRLAPGAFGNSGLACYVTGQGRVPVRWLGGSRRRFVVQAPRDLPPGRSRYNCTAPAGAGRYFWYSHPWLVLGEGH